MYKECMIGIASLFLLFLVCIGTMLKFIDPAMGMLVQSMIFGISILWIFMKCLRE